MNVLPIPQVEINPAESHNREMGKVQHIYRFTNGYSASVIQGPHTYGGRAGLWEIAVLGGPDERIVYDTPVTDDVLGYLTDDQVAEALLAIAALPSAS